MMLVTDGDGCAIGHFVECERCGFQLAEVETETAAIAAWNQRTTPAEVAALKREVERLREQLLAQQWWHDAEEKALSKQPPNADRDWRRLQHKEQSRAICAALAHKEPGDEG
jgi:hypothetical protein